MTRISAADGQAADGILNHSRLAWEEYRSEDKAIYALLLFLVVAPVAVLLAWLWAV